MAEVQAELELFLLRDCVGVAIHLKDAVAGTPLKTFVTARSSGASDGSSGGLCGPARTPKPAPRAAAAPAPQAGGNHLPPLPPPGAAQEQGSEEEAESSSGSINAQVLHGVGAAPTASATPMGGLPQTGTSQRSSRGRQSAAGSREAGGSSAATLETLMSMLQQLLTANDPATLQHQAVAGPAAKPVAQQLASKPAAPQPAAVLQPALQPASAAPNPKPLSPVQPASPAPSPANSASSLQLPASIDKLLSLELEVVQLQQSLQIAQLEFEARAVQLHSLKQRADEAEERAKMAEERAVALTQQARQLEKQAGELRSQMAEASAKQQQETAQLLAQLALASAEQKAAVERAGRLQQQLEAGEEQVARLHQQLQAGEERAGRLQQQLQAAEEQAARLQQQLLAAHQAAQQERAELRKRAADQRGEWHKRATALVQENQQWKEHVLAACGTLKAMGVPPNTVFSRQALALAGNPHGLWSPAKLPRVQNSAESASSMQAGASEQQQAPATGSASEVPQQPAMPEQRQQPQQQEPDASHEQSLVAQPVAQEQQAVQAVPVLPPQQHLQSQPQSQLQPSAPEQPMQQHMQRQQQPEVLEPAQQPGQAAMAGQHAEHEHSAAEPAPPPPAQQQQPRRGPPPQVPRLQLSSITLGQLQQPSFHQELERHVAARASSAARKLPLQQQEQQLAAARAVVSRVQQREPEQQGQQHHQQEQQPPNVRSPLHAAVAAAEAAVEGKPAAPHCLEGEAPLAAPRQSTQPLVAAAGPPPPCLSARRHTTAAQQELLAAAQQWQLSARSAGPGDAVPAASAPGPRLSPLKPQQPPSDPRHPPPAAPLSSRPPRPGSMSARSLPTARMQTPRTAAHGGGARCHLSSSTPSKPLRRTYGQDSNFLELKHAYNAVMACEAEANKWARSVLSSSSAVDTDPRKVEPMVQGLLQLFEENGVPIPLQKCGPCQYKLGSAKLVVRLVNGRLMARSGAGLTTDVFAWLEKQPVPGQ